MPFVDLVTKKIYGCKEGSRSYFHEKGHLLFDESDIGTRIKYYHYFFTMLTVVIIPFNFFINLLLLKIFTLICSFSVIITYLFEEFWCDLYSWKMTRHR